MCPWNLLNTRGLVAYPHGIQCALVECPFPVSKSGPMKRIHVVFHDGGGGHRNAAVALQTIVSEQKRDWQVELIQFQDLTDRLDGLRKLTGIRIQHQYKILLESFWRAHPADLLVSVIPHFNRQICESWTNIYPGRPFVTLITDLADFPPRFWIEPISEQYVIAGTEKAAEQARALGHDDAHIFRTSGMILRPDFYGAETYDAAELRQQMGLRGDLATAIVLFGGPGPKGMYDITQRPDAASLPLQLLLICGRNGELAAHMPGRQWKRPAAIIGFTKEGP